MQKPSYYNSEYAGENDNILHKLSMLNTPSHQRELLVTLHEDKHTMVNPADKFVSNLKHGCEKNDLPFHELIQKLHLMKIIS